MQTGPRIGTVSRRQFLVAGSMGSVALAAGCKSTASAKWEFFTPDEAQTLAALCDQIIPADNFPGASQVGVVDYIDRQLARFYQPHRDAYREGLQAAQNLSRKRFGQDFQALAAPQQLAAAIQMERDMGEFFEMVRRHTFEGYYGAPRHGGNRDAVSWQMLGLAEPPLLGRAQYDLGTGGSQ